MCRFETACEGISKKNDKGRQLTTAWLCLHLRQSQQINSLSQTLVIAPGYRLAAAHPI